MKYRKKPVVVEAHPMTEDQFEDQTGWPEWLKEAWTKHGKANGAFFKTEGGNYVIRTLEGIHQVVVNDFIIWETGGELCLCRGNHFWKTYEEVE